MVNPASSKPDPSKAGKIVSRGNIVFVPISLPSNRFISLYVFSHCMSVLDVLKVVLIFISISYTTLYDEE